MPRKRFFNTVQKDTSTARRVLALGLALLLCVLSAPVFVSYADSSITMKVGESRTISAEGSIRGTLKDGTWVCNDSSGNVTVKPLYTSATVTVNGKPPLNPVHVYYDYTYYLANGSFTYAVNDRVDFYITVEEETGSGGGSEPTKPPTQYPEDYVYGTCGDGVYYELNRHQAGSGYLEIRANPGSMGVISSTPWTASTFNGRVKKAYMSNDITQIRYNGFTYCYNMKSIVLSEKLTTIPYGVFYLCRSLEDVWLPEKIRTIGDEAFYLCALKNVYLSEKITKIGENAFDQTVTIYTPEGSYASEWAKKNGNPVSVPVWNEPEYEWDSDYKTVMGRRKCELFPKLNISERVNTKSEVTTAATCEENGITTYTAEFKNTNFSTQTRMVSDIPALGHDWDVPAYTWTEDNSQVTASRTCKRADHPETETVQTTSEVTVPATTEAEGQITYTAVFSNQAFETQTKVVTIPKLPQVYSVTVTNDGHGTAAANPASGESGTVVTLTATPQNGYRFGKWEVISGGVSVQDNRFTILTSDVEIKAVFEAVSPDPGKIPVVDPDAPAAGGAALKLNKATHTATVTGADSGKATTISIPAKVAADGIIYKVTEIASNAFKGNKKITKVSIGSNVKTIGKNAFYGCTKLKTVSGMSGLTTIGDGAFQKCTALASFTIEKQVAKIGKNSFNGCKKLAKITIKTQKLTKNGIGKNCFKGIAAKAVFNCPKKQLKDYKAWLKKPGGAPKKATFK